MEEKSNTETDSQWAHDNCHHIFQKYITERKEDSVVVVDEITRAFKDISIQFDFDEYEQLLSKEKERFKQDQSISKEEFDALLWQWILMFKKQVTSELISNWVNIVNDRYDKSAKEIGDLMKSLNNNSQEEINQQTFQQFITELLPILEVRIVNLNTKKPRSDENVWNEEDDQEFLDSLSQIMQNQKHKSVDVQTSKQILIDYFKGKHPKYCFVILFNFDNMEEIDPFADLGEEDPFNSQARHKKNKEKEEEEVIEQEINQAEIEGSSKDKINLLKKIKQFYVLKHTADSEREKEGLDLMIAKFRRQIAELDENDQNNQVNFNASVGDDQFKNRNVEFDEDYLDEMKRNMDNSASQEFLGYREQLKVEMERKQENNESQIGVNSNISRSPIRISRGSNEVEKRLESEPVETLEDKQNRGIKEIFDFYTRQHLMIGRKATFEQIEYELSNMNMGEFMKFWKDFSIPLSKTKWAEVFKKTAKNSKEMFLDNFKMALPKLIFMKQKEHQEELEKRLKEVKKWS